MLRRIVRSGRVVEARGEKVVRFRVQVGCPAAGGVCSCGRRDTPDLALKPLGLAPAVGERLAVSVTARGLAGVALVLFGVPLVMLVLGALAGAALAARLGWPADSGAGVLGVAALAAAWWLVLRSGGTLLRMLRLDVRAQ